jgi:3-oxoacyl-[acyl-carrier-protein] synthase I
MRKVYVAGDNIITSLGFTTSENLHKLKENTIGLRVIVKDELSPVSLPLSMIDDAILDSGFEKFLRERKPDIWPGGFTRLEKMFILSLGDPVKDSGIDPLEDKTLLILSTTKGNIDLLEDSKKDKFGFGRALLPEMAEVIRKTFGFRHKPLIVSNACISGVLALGIGYRYIRSGMINHAVVCGGDILSQFVISGFQSFQSLSPEPCRPYDTLRNGLSLGEACGTVVLTSEPVGHFGQQVIIEGTATSNDANHISGPSRTGEELALAVAKSMKEAHLEPKDIGYISAHGTATPFNDEMESKAFTIAGLQDVPLNSYKGYWGHTLGAAGLIESVAAIHSMKEKILIRTAGFMEHGVPEKIHIIDQNIQKDFYHLVKTASGFGGCNASIIFGKS